MKRSLLPPFRRPSSLITLLVIVFGMAASALAYNPVPDPLNLVTGASGVVEVHGSDPNAQVVLQSITITLLGASPAGGVIHDLVTPTRSGKGSVNVTLKGVAPGNYVVTFDGKNNTDTVQGSITVIVRDPPSTSAQNPFFISVGDPINTRSGEYFGAESVDLNLGGPMPLIFSRYVASNLSTDDLVQAALGTNRSHNFASRMISEGSANRNVILPSGKLLNFIKVGTKWVLKLPLDVPFQLVESAGSFLLGHPHTRQIWTYDNTGRLTKIEDGRGNAHTLTYTAGKLSSISDGLGRVINISQPGTTITSVAGVTGTETRTVTFAYNSGVLTSATDYGGHVTTFSNTGGQPTSFTRAQGNTPFTQSYTSGKVTSQTERGTDTSTLAYAANVTTFTDPTGETRVDQYDSKGNLTSHVDEEGRAITMTYDASGRRSSVTDRLGNKVTLLYHALSGLPSTIVNAEGKSTLFTYKARTLNGIVFQDLVKVTYPDLASRSFVYDAKGNLTQITDEAGKNWKLTYNTRGQVLTSTNPLGGVITYSFDAFGNLTSSLPPDNGATTYAYDLRHRLTQITKPGPATVVIGYDTKDRVTSITDERGKTYTYAYDSNNRLTGVTDPDNEVTSQGHDVLDRVTSITDAHLNQSTATFDSRRLLATRTDGNGNTVEMHFDSRQRLGSVEDAGGQMWTFGYDEEGRLVQAKNPIDPPAKRKLNKLGYPIELNDPLGNTRSITRDAMQRVTQSFDPLGRLTSYVYDKRGLLISATEQGTGTAKYDRDALGNIIKITDPNGGAWTTTYLKSGRVQKMTDPLGKSLSLTYDTRGRASLLTFADTTTCALIYDAASHLTSATFSAGPTLTHTYDDLGRLASTNDVTFEHDSVGRLTNCQQNSHNFTATYDDGNRLQTVSYLGGAFTVTYAYDSRNRLTSVTDSEGTSITLGYDNAGRLTSQTRTPGIDGTYTYDAAGRLTRIQEGGILDLSYELNPASEVTDVDITAPSLPSVLAGTQLLKFGKAGEIITPGHVYDARGRLTTAPGGRTYQWDGASRLTNASGVTLTYNGLADIVTRTESSDTTRYYHHYALGLAPIVYEDPPTGSDRAYVWTPGGRLLYSVDLGTGDPTYYHFDRMGSTLALTDKNNTVTDSYAYGPYGEPLAQTGSSTQPFTYIGAYGVRKEGPLYHMRARYYDPQAARFLSRDPRPPRLDDPKSTNRYTYASQNPLMYLDPNGEDDTPIEHRLRFNIDARKETDAGLAFGGRIRLQYDEGGGFAGEGGELRAAIDYAAASGYNVDVGASGAGSISASQLVYLEGSDSLGAFADYSLGNLFTNSKLLNSSFDSLTTMYNSELGFIGVGTDSPKIFVVHASTPVCASGSGGMSEGRPSIDAGYSRKLTKRSGIEIALKYLDQTAGLGFVSVPDAELDAIAEGVGASYDLGGASIGADIQRRFGAETYADLGVNFSF